MVRNVGVQFPAEARSSPFLTAIRVRTTQSTVRRLLGALSSETELSGSEVDNTLASIEEVKNAWNFTSTHTYEFIPR
jgi:hypothetical protein